MVLQVSLDGQNRTATNICNLDDLKDQLSNGRKMKDISVMCSQEEVIPAEVSTYSPCRPSYSPSQPGNYTSLSVSANSSYKEMSPDAATHTASLTSDLPPNFPILKAEPLSPLLTVVCDCEVIEASALMKTEVGSSTMTLSPALSPPSECQSPGVVPLSPRCKRSLSPGITLSGNLLPPCRICLDKASGFHYGLNTCEACKGFFRRSLKRGASYVCTRDGKCDVTGERRNLCGYCRYQKCIALGMSKKAIKTGRYTHAKRTRDTLEIKKLLKSEHSLEEEDINFDEIVEQIVKAHDEYIISSTKIPISFIQDRQKQKLEELRLQQEMFGKMITVSQDEHKEIYDLTGIDIDNRGEIMNFHVRNSEKWIRGYISFAKHLPGFRSLSLNDQANLVKCSFPGYSSELNVAVMPNGRCFTRQEMYRVWNPRYIDVAFDLAKQLKKLTITPEEMIMVKAICLTFGDRCKMEEPEKVNQVQWKMVRCLLHLLHQSHPTHAAAMCTFARIIDCLTGLRDLNEAEYQTMHSTQLYEVFLRNPLIMEVLPY
ncbi:nuclear receptor subfamily 1 group D member 1-like isoform X2 [Pomacea canaliculata]|uniref:nuclear receptor subfamily 1 group D member 1-like isoform X2 n=1 Tax=Pomacea canaliculata TaxID=400727 RepID=UPI000D72CA3B|nr:nuclear receptor subfamily 1 group D member 1-like isoform X2 [Pomacea canaliculata]